MSSESRDWFLERAAGAVPFLVEHFDPSTGCFHPEDWDERYNNVIYALAYLYCTEHPRNPHYRAEHLLQAALAGADCYVKKQSAAGEWPHAPSGGYCLAEWPAYYLTETFALLADGVTEEQRARWGKAIERYATHAGRRPFSFTSPSNEAWKCLTLYRAGQVLQRDEWCETGRFQMAQLNKLQRPEGCWEEPVAGHGPSPTYHHLHLGALGLYANYSHDAGVAPALGRAIDFAVAAAYPDGTPVDCLEGRSGFSPEAALSGVPGLSRSAAGRRLLASLRKTLDELRSADPRLTFASTWSAFIEPCFLVDAHRHFPAEEEPEPADRAELEGHDLGASVTFRNSPWFAAVCGEVCDTALLAPHRSAFERQSRVSLWHDEWGVLVGGGSQARTTYLPLSNVMLATDYRDVGCSFGEVRSFARTEPEDPAAIATAYHSPRRASVARTGEGLRLGMTYGHGDVTIELRALDPATCEIEFRTSLRGVKTACCQLPLLVTHHTRIGCDGAAPQPVTVARPEWLTRTVEKSLVVTRPDRDLRVVIQRPRDAKLKFHVPVHPGFGLREDEHFEPTHAVGLLSAEISRPEGDNALTFRIRVETGSHLRP